MAGKSTDRTQARQDATAAQLTFPDSFAHAHDRSWHAAVHVRGRVPSRWTFVTSTPSEGHPISRAEPSWSRRSWDAQPAAAISDSAATTLSVRIIRGR